MSGLARLSALAALAAGPLLAPAAAQKAAAKPDTASRSAAPAAIPDSLKGRSSVSYVSGTTAYVAAGVRDGIYHGSRVVVVRNGAIIAELKVQFLSSHSAACLIASSTTPVNEYDSVRYSKLPPESVTVASASPAAGPPQPSSLRRLGITGRVGLSYQIVNGTDVAAGKIAQPALDLNVVGVNVGGSKLSFAIDTRTRRTYTTAPDGTTSNDQMMRVYQASLSFSDPKTGALVTLGRQYVEALSSVSLFDGLTAEFVKPHWSYGLFGGTQPDIYNMGYSQQVTQFGGFVQVHQPIVFVPGQPLPARWSITLGGIGSYDMGQINREFMFLQAFYSSTRLTFFGTQEVDYNRGWKAEVGLPPLTLTSTFITAQLMAADFLSFYGGFDNRRNVLLYTDYSNPETAFDSTYREGVWGGISITPTGFFRIGGDARISTGGLNGKANSYTGWISADRGMPLQSALRLRYTVYDSWTSKGTLYAGSFGFSPAWRLRIEFNGGLRSEINPQMADSTGFAPKTNVQWWGADLDLGISRHWYFILTAMRTTGGIEGNDQGYAGVSYRF
ncbi:MAG TPA: hypothetical protein VMT93_07030 [Gemmatimonadaceae bacterium]|nr:hypothetical protein [Gemmatimonadaceae bacterium]